MVWTFCNSPRLRMNASDVAQLLKQIENGTLTAAEALTRLAPRQDDIGFACVDLDRQRRCGMPEVIYCPGKTPGQIAAVAKSLDDAGQDVLATRASPDAYDAVRAVVPAAVYNEQAQLITRQQTPPSPIGHISVVCAGTSDMPVAEEAAATAEFMGAYVVRVHDVGVAGLHRLLARLPDLEASTVVIAVAGMEGALPSVLGGLMHCPVIAVPTSVGYGSSFGGVTALLAMLNSCASGITVVNIDNGFGAAVAATRINRQSVAQPKDSLH
jgi:pyridinium-3,5-biscarboxylic acid mononucleotide synthase